MSLRSALLLAACGAALSSPAEKAWREKRDCRWVENPANDGDSFHVRADNREYIFRLLFVDCPETDTRIPERITEQAAYWGITEEQNLALGRDAAEFTRSFLKGGFTVHTQFEDARGQSKKDRDYAIVEAHGEDLAVALVSNGLARIFGRQAAPEDGPSETTIRFRLKTAEREAKKNRRGAWALVGKADRLPPPVAAPTIAAQARKTTHSTPLYASDPPHRFLGQIAAGKEIEVLGAYDAARVRVRFSVADGTVHEGLCLRSDLGL